MTGNDWTRVHKWDKLRSYRADPLRGGPSRWIPTTKEKEKAQANSARRRAFRPSRARPTLATKVTDF